MSVLIITERNDIHSDALIWALESMGVRCDRWSMSDFPEQQRNTIRISNSLAEPACKVTGLAPSMSYTSIWLRRLAAPAAISDRLAAADVQMAQMQAQRFAEGTRTVISPGSTWINPLGTRTWSTSKPYQLRAAREVGFVIPTTLISNDPDEIRAFYREHRGNVIYKPFTPAFWTDRTAGGLRGVFTSRLTEDLLAGDEASFTSCPGIYQECIEKKSELRVTFFGRAYQAARIYSQQIDSGRLDYRSDMKNEAPMEEAILDASLLEKCQAFAAKLGILHGSLDLIERPDGSIVFLEINEMGQFLWLEERVPKIPMLALFAAFSLEPSADFNLEARRPDLSFHDYLKSEAYPVFQKELSEFINDPDQVKPFNYTE
jgi:glutathione synthase/RimK-type ligase-like ATP-grasp enzyme